MNFNKGFQTAFFAPKYFDNMKAKTGMNQSRMNTLTTHEIGLVKELIRQLWGTVISRPLKNSPTPAPDVLSYASRQLADIGDLR